MSEHLTLVGLGEFTNIRNIERFPYLCEQAVIMDIKLQEFDTYGNEELGTSGVEIVDSDGFTHGWMFHLTDGDNELSVWSTLSETYHANGWMI